jgi:UDP-N-acetylglucosamine 4-epimerase
MVGEGAGQGTWLVTGAAGFIGSHLVEKLLNLGHRVIGVDNFSTGSQKNIDAVKAALTSEKAANFAFFELDVRDRSSLTELVRQHSPRYILHQAALGSVPRSIADPIPSHESNVDGFINLLEAARLGGVKRVVYASSSSVYGDLNDGAKREARIGDCLSPYAATKRVGEVYAQVYGRVFGLETIGLRYFNVFGPRQDPNGPYAAVIPRWLSALNRGESVTIYGDGNTSRDFCYIANVVDANIRAATVPSDSTAVNSVLNIACGATTTLIELERMLRQLMAKALNMDPQDLPAPRFEQFRQGDIAHSLADISLARETLGYIPEYSVEQGLSELVRSLDT